MARPRKPPRIKAVAANKDGQKWEPPEWGWRYIAAMLDPEVKPTISARCHAIGISRSSFYEAQGSAQFVQWLEAQLMQVVGTEHQEVRTALVRKCVTGDLEAIRLWHELYGNYIPTERRIVDANVEEGPKEGPNKVRRVGTATLEAVYRLLETGDSEGTGPKVN